MATTDEDLSQLEKDIRQLKIDYEQYFGGGKARPPTDTEWRIDSMLKRYSDRSAAMNYAQRYRYSNLAQTYVKYREMFRKRLKQKEEGIVQRHFGAAAKEIEKERALKRHSTITSRSKLCVTKFPFAISCADPDRETKKVQQLYSTPFAAPRSKSGKARRNSHSNCSSSLSTRKPKSSRSKRTRTRSNTSSHSKASTHGSRRG